MLSLITRRLDQRIWGELARQKRYIVMGLVFSGMSAAIAAGYIKLTEQVIKAIQAGDLNTLRLLCGGIVLAFGLRYFFTRGQFYYLGVAANKLTADLRRRVFEKLMRLPISYFNDRRSGAIQSVLTNDVNVFSGSIGMLRDSIDGPLKIAVGVVMIFVINWQLALVAIAIFPIMVFAIQRNTRKMKSAQAEVQAELAELTGTMQESISGVRVVRAFSAEERINARVDENIERTYRSQQKTVKLIANLRPLVELLGAVALVVVFYLCGYLEVEVAQIAAFALGLDYVNQGARNIGNLNQSYAQISAAADRVYSELLEIEETVTDRADARTIESPVGRIEFDNVSFEYPDGTKALSNVSFVLEPGTSLALVGPSGAGKSTIADLLLRFYDPTEGRILYEGVDIRELKGDWYRSQIGVVPQQTFLFAGTIADNLRLGYPEAAKEDVERATQAANAHDFITKTDLGYETVLGERGIRISGGEGQRLAIARALIRDPKVLLLDEATSNLDGHSERIVTAALEHAMERRTTLFIAHRLTTAARATKIVMLKGGEILEVGSHDDLVAQNGPYASMYRAFASGFLEESIG